MNRRAKQLALVTQYTPLVLKIAGGFQRKLPRNVLREDLIAAGMGGLWDAIRRNPAGPTDSFEWYVRVRIRGAILDELRAQDWAPRDRSGSGRARVAVVRFDDLSETEHVHALASGSADDESRVLRKSLMLAVRALPRRWREIIQNQLDGQTAAGIAKRLGISQPRVSQIRKKAIEMLRKNRNLRDL